MYYNLSSENMPSVFIGSFGPEFAKGPTFNFEK